MTGKFNETTRRLLRDSEINGGLDNRALFDLMVAGHEEGILAAEKLAVETKETAALLAATLVEDRGQLARIASHLESEAGSINRAIVAHCSDANAHGRAPRRSTDPLSVTYGETTEEGDMKRAWRIARWAGIVFGAASIVALADVVVRLIFGT